MYINTALKLKEDLPDTIACYFSVKISKLLATVLIDDQIYNGAQKVCPERKMFIDLISVRECIMSLKIQS